MNDMQPLPIDSAPCWCPSWDEIKDKAHMYRTARIRSTGQYVSLGGYVLTMRGYMFGVHKDGVILHYSTEELCDFCL